MKILHTSDWHLDARLEQCSRAEEHQRFFEWLRQTLIAEQVDVLLVAGDIFDSGSPGNGAYLRYTEFLRDLYLDAALEKSVCRNVIITAGNHDSPSFLQTSGPLLEVLGTHVVTQPSENLCDMIFPLKDRYGNVACICAAVPFLRDRDVTAFSAEDTKIMGKFPEMNVESDVKTGAGTTETESDAKTGTEDENGGDFFDAAHRVLLGFRTFYRKITDEALKMREEILTKEKEKTASESENEEKKDAETKMNSEKETRYIPILATGHLFTARGKTLDDDGVRAIHVGTLEQFPASDFPPELDYIALGHLHLPQIVDGKPFIRYSGSPIPIGFSEISTPKRVILLETDDENSFTNEMETKTDEKNVSGENSGEQNVFPEEFQDTENVLRRKKAFRIRELEIPMFRQMKVLRGESVEEIRSAASELAAKCSPNSEAVRVKVEFCGPTYSMNLNEEIEALFQAFPQLELVRFENRTAREKTLSADGTASGAEDLKELNREKLFHNFLETMHSNLPLEEKTELEATFSELLTLYEAQQAAGMEEETEAK